jgi:predicted nucleic acid-binding protein
MARNVLHKYSDKDLTYTDAINMAVMIRIGLKNVFAFDWHFTLLGFQVFP